MHDGGTSSWPRGLLDEQAEKVDMSNARYSHGTSRSAMTHTIRWKSAARCPETGSLLWISSLSYA